MPLDILFEVPHPSPKEYPDHQSYVRALQNRILCAHAWARKHIGAAIERQRRSYIKDKKLFTPGSKIWLFTPTRPPGVSSKLRSYYTGPWIVDKAVNPVVYRILPDPRWERKHAECVTIDRMKPYYEAELEGQEKMQPPPVNADLSMTGNEFAETLYAEDPEFEEGTIDNDILEQVPAPGPEPVVDRPHPDVKPPEIPNNDPAVAVTEPPGPLVDPVTPAMTPSRRSRARRLAEEAEAAYGPLPTGKRSRKTL